MPRKLSRRRDYDGHGIRQAWVNSNLRHHQPQPLGKRGAKKAQRSSMYLGVLPRVDVFGAADDRCRGAHDVAVHVAAASHRARPDLHDALRAERDIKTTKRD